MNVLNCEMCLWINATKANSCTWIDWMSIKANFSENVSTNKKVKYCTEGEYLQCMQLQTMQRYI